jgi:hypothetical protein
VDDDDDYISMNQWLLLSLFIFVFKKK